MRTVKKIAALGVSCMMLCAAMTGCADSNKQVDISNKVFNIGICQLVEHDALGAATQGFKNALTEKLGEDHVTFNEQIAEGDSAKCASICSEFVSGNCDLIMANATPALVAAHEATSSIPIVGTSVTDYASALNIAEWNGKTGMNITGTSDLTPIGQQEDMLVELFPSAKQVGILYNYNESNSRFQAKEFEEALTADGISYKEYSVTNADDVRSMTSMAVTECDVIYIPTDNVIAENASVLKEVTYPSGIPVIAGEEGICAECGVATLSISYEDIGYEAGLMAYDILVNGKKPEQMEIGFAPQVTKEYNIAICNNLGIKPPSDYVAIIGTAD